MPGSLLILQVHVWVLLICLFPRDTSAERPWDFDLYPNPEDEHQVIDHQVADNSHVQARHGRLTNANGGENPSFKQSSAKVDTHHLNILAAKRLTEKLPQKMAKGVDHTDEGSESKSQALPKVGTNSDVQANASATDKSRHEDRAFVELSGQALVRETHKFIILVVLVLAFTCACGLTCRALFPVNQNIPEAKHVRSCIEELQVRSWKELDHLLKSRGKMRYDCNIRTPSTSGTLVRFEAHILAPANESWTHTSPLARGDCVVYSSLASGSSHVAVAHKRAAMDFFIAPVDAPDYRILVTGSDVLLFDMQFGSISEECLLSSSPEHWKDFIREGCSTCDEEGAEPFLEDGELHHFEECFLALQTTATFAGELHCEASGELALKPRSLGLGPLDSLTATMISGCSSTALEQKTKNVSRVWVSDCEELLQCPASSRLRAPGVKQQANGDTGIEFPHAKVKGQECSG